MLAWRNWHTAAVAQALICLQFLFSTTSESPASCIWSLHNPLRNLGQRIPTCWSCPLAHSASRSQVISYSVRQIRVASWTTDVTLTSEYDLLLFFWHHQADCGDETPLVSIKHPYRSIKHCLHLASIKSLKQSLTVFWMSVNQSFKITVHSKKEPVI